MSHTQNLPPINNEPGDGDESFFSWAKKQIPFLITQVIFIFLALGQFFYYVLHGEEAVVANINLEQFEYLLYLFNLLFCVFCVIKIITIYNRNSFGKYTARKLYDHLFNTTLNDNEHKINFEKSEILLKKYKTYFLLFWLTLTVLYVTFIVTQPKHHDAGKLISETTTTTKFYYKIKEGNYKLTPEDGDKNRRIIPDSSAIQKDSFYSRHDHGNYSEKNLLVKYDPEIITINPEKVFTSRQEAINYKLGAIISYGLNTLSIMFIFWCFLVMSSKTKGVEIKIPMISSLIITILLIALYPLSINLFSINGVFYEDRLTNSTVFFDALSGVINGLILALFIARLDDKLLSVPAGLISFLYFYSAIQPLFIVFDLPSLLGETLKVIVLSIVLLFKIYFFFIVIYVIQTGRLLGYFYCFSTLDERIDTIVENSYWFKIKKV